MFAVNSRIEASGINRILHFTPINVLLNCNIEDTEIHIFTLNFKFGPIN